MACSALARLPAPLSTRSIGGRNRSRRRCCASRRQAGGTRSRRSRASASRGRRGRCGRRAASARRGKCCACGILKFAVLSFSVTVRPPSSIALARADTRSHWRHRMCSSSSCERMSVLNGRLRRDALHLAGRIDGAGVVRMRKAMQPQPGAAVAAREVAPIRVLDLADAGDAVLCEGAPAAPRPRRGSCPRACRAGTSRLRPGRSPRSRAACRAPTRAWRELVAGQPDGNRDADLVFDALRQHRHGLRRTVTMQALGPERSR